MQSKHNIKTDLINLLLNLELELKEEKSELSECCSDDIESKRFYKSSIKDLNSRIVRIQKSISNLASA